MNARCLIMLIAVVLGTSACASKVVQPPATASSQSTNKAPLGPEMERNAGAASIAISATTSSPGTSLAGGVEVASTATAEEAVAVGREAKTPPPEAIVQDPWEGYNRRMHSVNNVIDKYFTRPLAVAYDKVTPDVVQSSVSSFFRNLREPATAVNQALQGRPAHAAQSVGRFAVNTTVGIGGLFDPATSFGMEKRDGEDFGQTLATWGWRDSRYLVLPLFGPRTVRDTVAIVGDQPLSPVGYVQDAGAANALQILQMADGRARMLPMDQARRDALDEYAFVRDAWAQRRKQQIDQDLKSSRN